MGNARHNICIGLYTRLTLTSCYLARCEINERFAIPLLYTEEVYGQLKVVNFCALWWDLSLEMLNLNSATRV